jgi:hypothetical protein
VQSQPAKLIAMGKYRFFIIGLLLTVVLSACSTSGPSGGMSEDSGQLEVSALSAQEACDEATRVITKINNLQDILIDNFEDQSFVTKIGTRFQDAGVELSAVRSEDSTVDSAISEAGTTTTALGTALATSPNRSPEVADAIENALLAAVELQSSCLGY